MANQDRTNYRTFNQCLRSIWKYIGRLLESDIMNFANRSSDLINVYYIYYFNKWINIIVSDTQDNMNIPGNSRWNLVGTRLPAGPMGDDEGQ